MQRPHLSAPLGAIAIGLTASGSVNAASNDCLLFDKTLVLPPTDGYAQYFGRGLATDGERVVATAPAGEAEDRAVYVLERDPADGGWFISATLTPDLGPGVGNAAVYADIDGDTLVIGRSWFDDAKVYVYERSGADWDLVQTILPPGGATTFGESVQIDGDRLLVGLPSDDVRAQNAGAIAVYRPGPGGGPGAWVLDEVLRLDDAGSTTERLGEIMHLDGGVLACGLPNRTTSGIEDAGAVVVFEDTGEAFERTATLQSPDPWWVGNFGQSVAVDGDRIAVGAPGEWNNGLIFQDFRSEGRVRIYERNGADDWSLVMEDGPSAQQQVRVGFSVALRGDLLVAGGPFSDWLPNPEVIERQGVVLSFLEDPTDGWVPGEVLLAEELLPADGQFWSPTDYLGWSVAIVGDEVLTGATQVTIPGEPFWPMTGGLYVFDAPVACEPGGGSPIIIPVCGPGPEACPADLDCSGVVDTGDLSILLGGFGGNCQGDINEDDIVDSVDLGFLLGRFGEQCPPNE